MDLKEDKNDSLSNECTHWWIKTRFLYVLKSLSLIKSKSISVLDFGCGTAPNTYLLQSLSNVESVCAVDKMISGNLWKTWASRKIKFSKAIPDEKFDFIMAMDVLEHIENDQEVFESLIRKHLKENGVLLLTVPAYKFLWSSHDVSLEHKRRYSLKDLQVLALGLPVEVIYERYAFSFIFPFLYVIRKIKNLTKKHHGPELPRANKVLNFLLFNLGKLECRLGGSVVGTSVIFIVKKVSL